MPDPLVTLNTNTHVPQFFLHHLLLLLSNRPHTHLLKLCFRLLSLLSGLFLLQTSIFLLLLQLPSVRFVPGLFSLKATQSQFGLVRIFPRGRDDVVHVPDGLVGSGSFSLCGGEIGLQLGPDLVGDAGIALDGRGLGLYS